MLMMPSDLKRLIDDAIRYRDDLVCTEDVYQLIRRVVFLKDAPYWQSGHEFARSVRLVVADEGQVTTVLPPSLLGGWMFVPSRKEDQAQWLEDMDRE